MKKIFLIPLMTLLTCVMAWAGNQPAKAIEPVPFQFTTAAPAQKAAAPARMKAEAAEQDILLEYEGFSQHFTSLQAAFNALPENSTLATVTLMSDIHESYNKSAMLVGRERRVILDLNGYTIYSASDLAASSALIQNNGTMTITDSSVGGTGCINNQNTNPEDWVGNGQPYPYVAHNTITNCGTLNINAGTIMNYSEGGACYVVDNNNTSYDVILNISGTASLINTKNTAIRQFCNSTSKKNEVNISGGFVQGATTAIWMQLPGGAYSDARPASFNMSEGTVTTVVDGYGAFYLYSYGNSTSKVNVSISGGTLRGITWYDPNKSDANRGKLAITGGQFTRPNTYGEYLSNWYNETVDFHNATISGGSFNTYTNGGLLRTGDLRSYAKKYGVNHNYAKAEYWEGYGYEIIDSIIYDHSYPENIYNNIVYNIKNGFCTTPTTITNEDENIEIIVAPCNSQEVTESKTMADIADEIADAGEVVSASIIEINAAATEEKAVVTVNDDIEVEGIVIKNDNNKEGQIVVESGVTLTVGNSGIVSENDELTTVVVKPGGTVVVGNGGVDQQGTATPVEIQSSDTESGVFMVDPNAPDSVAEAPAKVKVYTRAYSKGGVSHWQQLASPVKGDSKNNDTIKVTPLVDNSWDWFETSMYSWDYATDSWVNIADPAGEGMYDNGNGVYVFGQAGWRTTSAVLKPFAAYDLINNSWPSDGGITYEFAGELVGNKDMVLSFPENGFCTFGNSYTAPIDLKTFFDKIKNDMATAADPTANTAIDPCVYLFNSEKNRFESVNSLKLKMNQLTGKEIPFTHIPPQQAFVMNLLKGNSAQSSISYATSVWANPTNAPILAPQRHEESTISAMVEINVTDGNETDHVMLVQDEEYNNEYDLGADAMKYMNGAFNLYANTTIGKLDVVATDDIENTELSFQAGNSVNYTMSFNNVEGDFVLVDRANNSQVTIEEGVIYTFVAQPNATAEARFAVVPAAKMPTAIGNTEVKSNIKGIYSITGQYLGEDFNALPAGVYVIDGVKIVK